jgi:hypothetical protein
MKYRSLVVAILVFACTSLAAQAPREANSNDPSLGTWVLNAQKSKLPGPAPKTFIERYDLRADGFFVSTRAIVGGDSSPSFQQLVFKLDGKEYELWDNSTLSEFLASRKRAPQTLSGKVVDAYTISYEVKQAGKVVITGTRTISKDGKTMTFSAKTLSPQRQWIEATAVFDKV